MLIAPNGTLCLYRMSFHMRYFRFGTFLISLKANIPKIFEIRPFSDADVQYSLFSKCSVRITYRTVLYMHAS